VPVSCAAVPVHGVLGRLKRCARLAGMADVRIRRATTEDLDALVEIHLQARDTYYRGVIADEELDDPAEHAELRAAYERGMPLSERALSERAVLCAEQDGVVIGFVALGPPFEPVVDADPRTVGQLFGLYVRPSHWGVRVGSSLHEESVRFWRSAGVTTARLEVWEGNERAGAFYARRGWRPDGYQRPGPGDASFRRLCLGVSPSGLA
jgi:ribosomal protein S18 acetylase RimI-like enzyme